jgi:hypothetical protein
MYTKGEWKQRGLIIVDENNIIIADARMHSENQLYGDNHGKPYTEICANANLIASAPDMYEALKKTLNQIRNIIATKETIALIDEIEKALAKAEGHG